MALVTISEDLDFTTEFPNWIIAFCPDTNSWFCTNKRFFYYEYPKEFQSEVEAIEYFKNNVSEFLELNQQMYPATIDRVYLENTFKFYVGGIG